MTTDDYLRTPETVLPQELVYGVVREAAAPTPGHQDVVGNLYWHLRGHLDQTGAGKTWLSAIDVVLDRERGLVVQPDLIVVMNARLHIVTDRVWGAPDLAIEVLSPKPRIGTLAERIGWFGQYGVRECWLVRQVARTIEVVAFDGGHVRTRATFAGDTPLASGVMPELQLAPEDVLPV